MDPTYVVKNSSTISSPALLLYLEKLQKIPHVKPFDPLLVAEIIGLLLL